MELGGTEASCWYVPLFIHHTRSFHSHDIDQTVGEACRAYRTGTVA